MQKIYLSGFLAILPAALFLSACKNKDLEAFNSLEKDRFLVKIEKAARRDIMEKIVLVGSVKAMDEAVLYSRVSGKLLKNLLTEGDTVENKQAVALVERDEVGAVYEPAPVPSTLTGVIGRVYQDTGADVTPQTPIALVVSQGRVRVVIELPERYSGKVFQGQTAYTKVDAFPDTVFSGKVYRVSPVVDTKSRSSVIEILTENTQGKLKSGMFAEVQLVVDSRSGAVAVPSAAVQKDEAGKAYIFVPAGGIASRREIKPGVNDGDYTQIASGLKEGEEIISFGLYGLKDGSKIKVQ